MEKLISKEERVFVLIKFGAPKLFIENIGKIPELEFRLQNEEGAYFYLPTISNYEILKGLIVVPIYGEGETFWVLGYNDKVQKIIHFELENDEIYTDYGNNWDLLLMDIMTQYFEDKIGITNEDFKRIGKRLAFQQAESLFTLLSIPLEEYKAKYNEKEKWRIEIAKKLKIL